MDRLFQFLAEHPCFKYATPTCPEFVSWRLGSIVDEACTPAVIVRPRSAEDVAGLVSVLAANNLAFTVRVGGHEMFGRSQTHDGITIDLREISYITVDQESHTARLGGGILIAELIKELEKHNLVTPHGLIPSVGYVGWATHGGYGLLSAQYGLGADQILEAKVVDCQGVIQDADKDMLTAIRGAGGLLGVIVEVTINVYPLSQVGKILNHPSPQGLAKAHDINIKVLAGVLIYESSDLGATIKRYNSAYSRLKRDGLPSALSLYQCVMNGPAGKAMTVLFAWVSSDLEAGMSWLSKVNAWSPVAVCTVSPTTMAAFSLAAENLMPKSVYGTVLTANVHELTPEIVDVIALHASMQPNNPAVLFGIHELRACTPHTLRDSVFCTRSPHFVLEIAPIVQTPDLLNDAIEWGQILYDALHKTDPANIMASTYLPLTRREKVDMRAIYGHKLEALRDIKQRDDPQNVFKHALVQL